MLATTEAGGRNGRLKGEKGCAVGTLGHARVGIYTYMAMHIHGVTISSDKSARSRDCTINVQTYSSAFAHARAPEREKENVLKNDL